MRTTLIVRASALFLGAAAFLWIADAARAQVYRPPFGGPTGNPYGNQNQGNRPNGGAQFNQNQGIIANQTNTRSRFALNTSVTGSGVMNSSLDSVTQFGIGLNTNNQSGGGGGGAYGGGAYGGGAYGGGGGTYGGGGINQQTNNGLGSLSKQPPGVIMNAMFNGSTTYGIYGNQATTQYQGASPQQYGGYGGGYGGGYPGGGFPGGFQNGGYGY